MPSPELLAIGCERRPAGRSGAGASSLAGGLLAVVLFAGGCATAPPAPVVVETPIVRPVIVVERAQSELVATLDVLKAGNLRQAEANLEEIIKVRPDIPEAHFNLGWARHGLGRYDLAIKSFEEGLRLRPDDVQALNMLALCQREAGRFSDAEATYRRAIAVSPGYDKVHLNLGILYELYLNQPEKAIETYQRYQALQKSPDPKVASWITLLERRRAKP